MDPAGTVLASAEMIISSTRSGGSSDKYSFFDPNGSPSSVYYVQSVATDGAVKASQMSSVEFVNDLEASVGRSADSLSREVEENKRRGNLTSSSLELPKTVAAEVAANRLSADSATHAWVVSQPGARIGIRGEGFYRVSKAQLQAAGFDVNGDSSLWQLYREGVEQAIIVGPNADYIDFYGKGVDTPEADMGMYYLVSGPTAGKRIQTRSARPPGASVSSPNYSQVFIQKQRTIYLSDVLNGDAENYWGSVIGPSGDTNVNFSLSGVDFATADSSLEVKLQGYAFVAHVIQVTLNGNLLENLTGNSRSPMSKQYVIPTSHLREGANTISFRAIGAAGGFSLFDSIAVGFGRKFRSSQNRLKFYTSNYRQAKLEGFSSANVRVFDMTAEHSPVLWTNLTPFQDGPTFSVRMPADRGKQMYAVEDSGLQSAASVTANNPFTWKTNTHEANLVIISYKDWMTQAQNWANYRTGQGFNVKVVEVSEIFDEFSYGETKSLAIRDFLQYAENNWPTPPDYVLLLGDASFDARNYQNLGYHNYVPTHIVNTVFTETGSDDFLADFDGDGLAEMAVGRIPARTGQAITDALAKVTTFEAAAPTMQSRGITFAYDCFDAQNNYNFEQYSIDLRNQLPGGVTSTMIGRCDPAAPDTPQTRLINSINSGEYLVNYSGHGTTGAWVNSSFFSNLNVPQLTNANNQAIFTMLTCLNAYFLHVSNKSLAETLLESTAGGAVAAWASTGETTPDVQNAMAARFFNRLGNGGLERLGPLVNDAKSVIPGGTDVRLSWALIGDPMLKVRSAGGGDRPGEIRSSKR